MELNEIEQSILMVFRVTGFFGKTPKKDVSRNSSGVWRGLQTNNANVTLEDVAPGLQSLADKGLLRLEGGTAHLTDAGYEAICS